MTDIPVIITRNGTVFSRINPAFREALDRVTVLRMTVPEDQRDHLHRLEVSLEATKRYYEIAEMVNRTRTNREKLADKVRDGSVSQQDADRLAAEMEAALVKFVTTVVRLTPGEDSSLIKHR